MKVTCNRYRVTKSYTTDVPETMGIVGKSHCPLKQESRPTLGRLSFYNVKLVAFLLELSSLQATSSLR